MNKRLLMVSAIVLVFAGYLYAVPFHVEMTPNKAFSQFPLQWQGWNGSEQFFNDLILDKLKVTEYLSREYVKGPARVGLYVGYYASQREGAQIHSPKHCLPGGGWRIVSETTRSLDIPKGGKVDFVEAVYQKGEQKEVFVYWYKMKDACLTSDYALKYRMILNSLRYRRNDAAFVRLSASVRGSVPETVAELEGYMRDFMPLLKEYLPE